MLDITSFRPDMVLKMEKAYRGCVMVWELLEAKIPAE